MTQDRVTREFCTHKLLNVAIADFRKSRRVDYRVHRRTWSLLCSRVWSLSDFGLFYLSLSLTDPVLSARMDRSHDFQQLREHLPLVFGI
jgi:hypothetical protein